MDGTRVQDWAMRRAAELPEVTHAHPFGPDHEVFTVGGRIFLMATEAPGRPIVTVKCEPSESEALRQELDAIVPGYHMNKRHWISVTAGPGVTRRLVHRLVVDSYLLVLAGLPRDRRPRLEDALLPGAPP